MGPREIAARLRDEAVKASWRRLKGKDVSVPLDNILGFGELRISPTELGGPGDSRELVAFAAGLLGGRLSVFGRETDLPRNARDWFVDPDSECLAPMEDYAFDIDSRDPAVVGNHKFLLEPSRLQHVTALAAAWSVTGREAYAELAAAQIRAWNEANPFLSGIHWTSGIEVGIRLVSFVWARRLLRGWKGVADCFERSRLFRIQAYRHLQYLAGLGSHGSSANNHLIAELVGQFVGASAFPWFKESARWRQTALDELTAQAQRQTFGDGLNREQASEYHGFVLELLLTAAIEDMVGGRLPPTPLLECIAKMADAWAAILDCRLRSPRQGDSDDAYGLLLDSPNRARLPASILAAARSVVGATSWWPDVGDDLRSRLILAVQRRMPVATEYRAGRPLHRPSLFREAGLVLLRDIEPRADELWCRCDAGPHGFLSIAGHAHADALSVELRHAGVDILADPGTYCYLVEPSARRYFRSTLAHNTLEIAGKDQARWGGPFMWLDAPKSVIVDTSGLDSGRIARWTGRHFGYAGRPDRAIHQRDVVLDRQDRWVLIEDRIIAPGPLPVRLAFHLGPTLEAVLAKDGAELSWESEAGMVHARLALPSALSWKIFRGSVDPFLGWYAPRFGQRLPSITLVGEAVVSPDFVLRSRLTIGNG
jgi:hypothetical protein